jgi:hypothetical protein
MVVVKLPFLLLLAARKFRECWKGNAKKKLSEGYKLLRLYLVYHVSNIRKIILYVEKTPDNCFVGMNIDSHLLCDKGQSSGVNIHHYLDHPILTDG